MPPPPRLQQQRQGQRQLTASSTASEGSLNLKPLELLWKDPFLTEDNKDAAFDAKSVSLSTARISCSAAGQTVTTSSNNNSNYLTITAPLSQLYRSQLHLQVECPSTNATAVKYRGSYAVDDLPIQQGTVISVPLQPQNVLVVNGVSSEQQHQQILFLRLQVHLQGPLRTEIQKAHQALTSWLRLVDRVESVVSTSWKTLVAPHIPPAVLKHQTKILLGLPAAGLAVLVPLLTIVGVIVSPVAIFITILFFPIMIPLVITVCLLVVATIVAFLALATGLYASSRRGRRQLQDWWQWQQTQQTQLYQYWTILRGPRFGLQTFYYNTGPRPTPVTLTRTQLPKEKWRRLGVSLTIDGVGSFSYLLPFVGEVFDVFWAPTQTVLIMALYQHVSPNMSYVSFAEEMLPFLDVLPSATTGWVMEFGPELLEEAQSVLKNPSAMKRQVQTLLWGNHSESERRHPPQGNRRSLATSGGGNYRALPKTRPSRNP